MILVKMVFFFKILHSLHFIGLVSLPSSATPLGLIDAMVPYMIVKMSERVRHFVIQNVNSCLF